jgi:catechol 2,3-dioxygenase-like lactoylglutathione lyase family enzyme
MFKTPASTCSPSNHVLELVEYVAPDGIKLDTGTCNVGSAHMAFVVDDIFATYEAWRQQGVRFKSDPVAIESGMNEGGYTVYFFDPDDITLEIIQPPPHRLASTEA